MDENTQAVEQLLPGTVLERPRVWPALLLCVLVPIAAIGLTGIVVVVLVLAHIGSAGLSDQAAVEEWVAAFGSTPYGLGILVLPAQFVFLAAVFGAAALSKQRIAERLALRRSALPLWSWPFLMVGTLGAGIIGAMLIALLPQRESDQLTMIYEALAGASGFTLFFLLFAISIVPGFAEEALFRGYVQSRLLKRWPPVFAIGYSAVFFALAHMDPAHMLAVVPIGIWLGIVAWRGGSIVPAIVCHLFNNAVGVFTASLANEKTIDSVGELPVPFLVLIALGTAGAIVVLIQSRSSQARLIGAK